MNTKPFKPRKITDPRTGEERIVSPEEQKLMLEKGILFDIPSRPVDSKTKKDEHE